MGCPVQFFALKDPSGVGDFRKRENLGHGFRKLRDQIRVDRVCGLYPSKGAPKGRQAEHYSSVRRLAGCL